MGPAEAALWSAPMVASLLLLLREPELLQPRYRTVLSILPQRLGNQAEA